MRSLFIVSICSFFLVGSCFGVFTIEDCNDFDLNDVLVWGNPSYESLGGGFFAFTLEGFSCEIPNGVDDCYIFELGHQLSYGCSDCGDIFTTYFSTNFYNPSNPIPFKLSFSDVIVTPIIVMYSSEVNPSHAPEFYCEIRPTVYKIYIGPSLYLPAYNSDGCPDCTDGVFNPYLFECRSECPELCDNGSRSPFYFCFGATDPFAPGDNPPGYAPGDDGGGDDGGGDDGGGDDGGGDELDPSKYLPDGSLVIPGFSLDPTWGSGGDDSGDDGGDGGDGGDSQYPYNPGDDGAEPVWPDEGDTFPDLSDPNTTLPEISDHVFFDYEFIDDMVDWFAEFALPDLFLDLYNDSRQMTSPRLCYSYDLNFPFMDTTLNLNLRFPPKGEIGQIIVDYLFILRCLIIVFLCYRFIRAIINDLYRG